MEAVWLAAQLEAGRSIESIARETGRAPSTVAYWVNKHGLASRHAPKHAARGGIDRDVLTALVERGKSIREIAAELDRSATAVRHWLAKFDLQTVGAARRLETSHQPAVVRECATHGWTTWVRTAAGRYRCKRCRIEARNRPSPARQGDPRRRGRRRMPALWLLAVCGRASVSPRRSD